MLVASFVKAERVRYKHMIVISARSVSVSASSMRPLLVCVLVLLGSLGASRAQVRSARPTVTVESGILRGTHQTTANGRRIFAFEGIPYAKPPVGKNRFKDAQPMKPWKGIWDASMPGSVCLQYDHMTYLYEEPIIGDEDCLYLNVYTPKLPTGVGIPQLFDVIVYIHGGAFTYGGGHLYKPKYLLDRDVVFVTINYRLGPLGFLSTGDGVLPGNTGLKDQVTALQWIQRNIALFGGNPNSVTITGMSAGGASVHYHYLSPLSVGLFHRGISMSGSTLCPWTQTEEARAKAVKLANALGCPTITSAEIVDCLKHRPARTIVRLIKPLFMPWHYNPYTPFGPVVEVGGLTPFLTQHPYEILSTGNIQDLPWLASVTTEEGLYPVSNFVADAELLKEIETKWLLIAPHLLDYNFTVQPLQRDETSIKIKQHYLGNESISRNTTAPFIQMIGDRLFVVDVERAARLQAAANTAPVYFYRFAYRGKHSYSELMSWGSTENFGVSHGDDTGYILGNFYMNPEETEEDKQMTQKMLDIWTSFAKTGIPTVPGVTWTPVSPAAGITGNLDYLAINSSSNITLQSSLDLGHRGFWDSLPLTEPANLETASAASVTILGDRPFDEL